MMSPSEEFDLGVDYLYKSGMDGTAEEARRFKAGETKEEIEADYVMKKLGMRDK